MYEDNASEQPAGLENMIAHDELDAFEAVA